MEPQRKHPVWGTRWLEKPVQLAATSMPSLWAIHPISAPASGQGLTSVLLWVNRRVGVGWPYRSGCGLWHPPSEDMRPMILHLYRNKSPMSRRLRQPRIPRSLDTSTSDNCIRFSRDSRLYCAQLPQANWDGRGGLRKMERIAGKNQVACCQSIHA